MINKSLPNFAQASVLVLGDIMLDRYWFGDASRISPEAPVPIVKIKQFDDRPGGAGNVALNIAALSAKVTLLGITGNDDAARILSEQLTEAGVNSAIQHLDNISTITKLRVISRHQQLIRLDFEEEFPDFNPETIFSTYQKELSSTHLVVLSDYNKGTLLHAPELIRLAKEASVPVLVDPKGNDFTIYRGADVITPNLKEFEVIVGSCKNEQELISKAQKFLHDYDIKTLLLTRGEAGMTLIQRNEEPYYLPAHAREVFDVTGAGDTVIAVMGAALAAQAPIKTAMELANFAASLVVSKLGAATITVVELQAAYAGMYSSAAGIVDEEQLVIAVNEARAQGKRIVFTNGCFDILHAGHVTYLEQAKQLGDFLIVAVNDDASITRLKGPTRPINQLDQRMRVLSALSAVDWVIPFADDTPRRLLKLIQPDILVKGGDYTFEQVVGWEIVHAYGGDVRVLGVVKDLSTTAIVERAVKNNLNEKTTV